MRRRSALILGDFLVAAGLVERLLIRGAAETASAASAVTSSDLIDGDVLVIDGDALRGAAFEAVLLRTMQNFGV
jgi:hypothetical protein